MFWNNFKKKKPKKDGWYQCTVEVPGMQRYVMDLYWYGKQQKFKDNRRQYIFNTYDVYNYKEEKMYTCNLCDRTENVIACRKLPKVYMRGFKEE